MNLAPLDIVTTHDDRAGRRLTQTGIGDLYVRAKLNLIGDDGGDVAIALAPYVKAPMASAGLGNGAVEGGLIVPLAFNLPAGWSLTLDPEADVLANAAGRGGHANIAGLINASRAISKTLTASVEVWSDVNFDPTGTVRQYSFDLGLAWIPASRPNLQLDSGVNLGLNRQTPAAQAYLGLSQRF